MSPGQETSNPATLACDPEGLFCSLNPWLAAGRHFDERKSCQIGKVALTVEVQIFTACVFRASIIP